MTAAPTTNRAVAEHTPLAAFLSPWMEGERGKRGEGREEGGGAAARAKATTVNGTRDHTNQIAYSITLKMTQHNQSTSVARGMVEFY